MSCSTYKKSGQKAVILLRRCQVGWGKTARRSPHPIPLLGPLPAAIAIHDSGFRPLIDAAYPPLLMMCARLLVYPPQDGLPAWETMVGFAPLRPLGMPCTGHIDGCKARSSGRIFPPNVLPGELARRAPAAAD